MHGKFGHRWFGFVVMAAAMVAIAGFVVMSLWNWLMPVIFSWKEIGYLQALGLMLLGRLLFGGFRHGHGMFHGHWHHHMASRWEKMSPEEREKFRTGMHHCWGHGKSTESGNES